MKEVVLILISSSLAHAEGPWARHTIDDSSKGADGIRLADINGDGLPDIATGWEEGGIVRAYLHPGKAKAKQLLGGDTVKRPRHLSTHGVSCEQSAKANSSANRKW